MQLEMHCRKREIDFGHLLLKFRALTSSRKVREKFYGFLLTLKRKADFCAALNLVKNTDFTARNIVAVSIPSNLDKHYRKK